jgi:cyclopropane-fatty-acyl-phospholipid synthase
MSQWLERNARRLFLKSLEDLPEGFLEIVCREATYAFGDANATLRALIEVHNERFFVRALLGGDIGIGESYMDGDWSSPDVVSAVRIAVRNAAVLEPRNRGFSAVRRALDSLEQRFHKNSLAGSVKNIRAHYDLGNDFFRLFLDDSLMYSCAYFRSADESLEMAQAEKLDLICRKLRLAPADRVLEIGTGWGGFAFYAARHYGCHITTTTISRKQHDYVADRLSKNGNLREQIELQFKDYRHLEGAYDKIVSIEMFEAVGFEHYDDFFSACDRLLKPDGTMLLQTITMQDQKFRSYLRSSDWLKKYIFPGSQLASLSGVLASLVRSTKMGLYHSEDIGIHYARTLEKWRARFHARVQKVRELGFDERFIRMWDFYLASCAGSFLERYVSDVQLLLSKNLNRQPLMFEHWRSPSDAVVMTPVSSRPIPSGSHIPEPFDDATHHEVQLASEKRVLRIEN